MQAVTLIAKKRDKQALTKEELRFLVEGCVTGALPDYQTAAFLMAVCLNGMDAEETAAFTELLRDSGGQVDLSFTSLPKVDKHSTGGVGDTTTLILAPLLAACGVAVPKLSGRGLGHTGGTLDKLESLQGVQASVDAGRFAELVKTLGFCRVQAVQHAGSGRRQALRPARRDRHGGQRAVDGFEHHEQKARHTGRRHGAGHQGRFGRAAF